MDVNKLGPIGAEVCNIDLSTELSDEQSLFIRQAFLEHSVLVFKNQNLEPSKLLSLSGVWGKAMKHPIFPGIKDHPEIIQIENLGEQYHTNSHWHSDVTFETEPPDATLLYSLEIPDVGGDTLFSNQYLAYEALDQELKDQFSNTGAYHSNLSILTLVGADTSLAKRVLHPIFRTHPETNKKALFVTEAFVEGIDGYDQEDSNSLLKELYGLAVNKNFIYRHKWSKGDLVVWDNRCVQHFAEHGYGNKTRTMHRITVEGSKPF